MKSATSNPVPIVRGAADGERRWFYGGGVHTWKATAEETNGAFLLFEDSMDLGKATPLHTHPDSDETMVVLDGEIVMHMGGTDHRIARGGVAVAPRGVPHAFLVVSATARLLCLHTPGCCQAFYWDASEPIAADEPATRTVDFAVVQASAKANGGIVILGPPPFTRDARTYG
jgi:quercetin dioxygenase-like cupin family protein